MSWDNQGVTESKLTFSRDKPLRGHDGPTPDYIAPETGNYGKRSRIFAILAAISIGVVFVVLQVMGDPFESPDPEGFEVVSGSGLPALSIVNWPNCELYIGTLLENVEDQVLTTTGTSAAFRTRMNNAYAWPEVAGEIDAVSIEPGATKFVEMRFPLDECVAAPSNLRARDWSVSFERLDGSTGSSSMAIMES